MQNRLDIIKRTIDGIQREALSSGFLEEMHRKNYLEIDEKNQTTLQKYFQQKYKGNNIYRVIIQQIINSFDYKFSEFLLFSTCLILALVISICVPFFFFYVVSGDHLLFAGISTILAMISTTILFKDAKTLETLNFKNYERDLEAIRENYSDQVHELFNFSKISSNSVFFNTLISEKYAYIVFELSNDEGLSSTLKHEGKNITLKNGLNFLFDLSKKEKGL